MRIGIVTFHFSNNFGAALQAYALRRWLTEAGYCADLINYSPSHVEHGGDIRFSVSRRAILSNLKVIYLKQAHLRTQLFGNRRQRHLFERFRRENLGISGQKYTKLSELELIGDNYDLLICGSDQIWSPSVQYGLDPAYFLKFGKVPRRISYAASFGSADYETLTTCDIRKLLDGLDEISIREDSGVDLVRMISGVKGTKVVDPTALLPSYQHLIDSAESVDDEGHLFCYALRTDAGVREISQFVSSKLGLEVVAPRNPHSRWRAIGSTRHPGPNEWLALIARSSFVVTNSFHGTLFSLLLKKPFLVAAIPGKKVGLNDRMESLLKSVGLHERLVYDVNKGAISGLLEIPIDWESAFEKLSRQIGHSERFLIRQIELAATPKSIA
ncbi:polysaccharide pyruvyl transferase family protein [Haloferula sargassicola]|uniref:Polysaccharide pyruvyl transferase domain-containing protein n=1 Tax=Haloferula sargassicola TaxID=490096 RepID=A0ABP9UR18_9BACT